MLPNAGANGPIRKYAMSRRVRQRRPKTHIDSIMLWYAAVVWVSFRKRLVIARSMDTGLRVQCVWCEFFRSSWDSSIREECALRGLRAAHAYRFNSRETMRVSLINTHTHTRYACNLYANHFIFKPNSNHTLPPHTHRGDEYEYARASARFNPTPESHLAFFCMIIILEELFISDTTTQTTHGSVQTQSAKSG